MAARKKMKYPTAVKKNMTPAQREAHSNMLARKKRAAMKAKKPLTVAQREARSNQLAIQRRKRKARQAAKPPKRTYKSGPSSRRTRSGPSPRS